MEDEEVEFPKWYDKLFEVVDKMKGIWIIFVLLVLIWGGLTGENFVRNSQDVMHPPKGSRSYNDLKTFESYFPELANEKFMILLIECTNDQDKSCLVACPSTKCGHHCFGESFDLSLAIETLAKEVLSMEGVSSAYHSYYNFSNTLLDVEKCSFVSKDGKATFATFSFLDQASNPERHSVINRIKNELIPKLNPDSNKFSFKLTGFDPMAKEGSETAIRQMFNVDIFTMPVAFAMLGYMVRSWRLLLLAGLNTAVSMAFTFAFISWILDLQGTRPMSTVSSLVEVLGLAMAIDYSLFLLRRFRDELKNKRKPYMAIKVTMFHAGHVVLLSSVTFSFVFVGFQFLPSIAFQSIGESSLIAIVSALFFCMTNTACFLLLFPKFFSDETTMVNPFRWLFQGKRTNSPSSSSISEEGSQNVESPLLIVSPLGRTITGRLRHRRGAKYDGLYFRVLKKFTTYPFNILLILVVYGLCVPIALKVTKLEHNQDVTQAISRNAKSSIAFADLRKAFPGGTLSPFYVLMESPYSIRDPKHGQEVFNVIHKIVNALEKETGVDKKFIISPATLQGKSIDYSTAESLLDTNSLFCQKISKESCALYSSLFSQFVSKNNQAILISLTINENPYGSYGEKLIEACYEVFDEQESFDIPKEYKLHLSGDEVYLYSDQLSAFNALPILILVTVSIIFILLGLGFKSIMTPIRLSLTVFFPLFTVFGLGVAVYQEGALDWTGLRCFQKTEAGFYWYVPLVCLMQALGLTIDYDVFCVSRIVEHRSDGYSIQAAIIKAVWEVSSTICVAGLIMAAVFSGLLLGDSPSLNQFGFLLCTSVLVDTFIVQTILVPAIISIGDNFAWYPRKMPQNGLITLDDIEFVND